MPEFEHWKAITEGAHTWRIKYYKGLGTSTSAEAKQYFSDMDRHCIQFKYTGREDDEAIELVRTHTHTHTYEIHALYEQCIHHSCHGSISRDGSCCAVCLCH